MSAALAVAAIIVGWALAQQPWILPGLISGRAAAGQSTLLAVTVVVAISAIVSVPSRLLLFACICAGGLMGEQRCASWRPHRPG